MLNISEICELVRWTIDWGVDYVVDSILEGVLSSQFKWLIE